MTLGKDKIHFMNTPTPLHRLDRISADLDVEFYMKRDDLTNFGTGAPSSCFIPAASPASTLITTASKWKRNSWTTSTSGASDE